MQTPWGASALTLLLWVSLGWLSQASGAAITLKPGDSIQAAIDAHPGRLIELTAGDYPITKAILINTTDTGLFGHGRIIQTNPEADIILIKNSRNNRIEGLALTRPEGRMQTNCDGIFAEACRDVTIASVHLRDNRGPGGSIKFDGCQNGTVLDCKIENYKGFTIDDRTKTPRLGYSFRAIDGTGIKVFRSQGTLIQGNRIIESNLLPTKEVRDQHKLGEVLVLPKVKGAQTPAEIFKTRYTTNWHQGSGLIVGGGCSYTRVLGNYIENCAQGMDIHSDYIVVSNNIVTRGMMGVKAVHGAKHVLIIGNQLSKIDLFGILLGPGAASRPALAATGQAPAQEANISGQNIVANNIISDLGYGNEFWNRAEGRSAEGPNCEAIALQGGTLPENPPLQDILITGNVVYNTGSDQVLVEGRPQTQPPRYRHALYVDEGRNASPVRVHAAGNLFDPGSQGVSNIELKP